MKKYFLFFINVILVSTFNANALVYVDLKNVVFPSVSLERAERNNPYYIRRSIIFSEGKVVEDYKAMDSSNSTEWIEKNYYSKNFCKFDFTYFSETGFSSGKTEIPASKYNLVILLKNIITSTDQSRFYKEYNNYKRMNMMLALDSIENHSDNYSPEMNIKISSNYTKEAKLSLTNFWCSSLISILDAPLTNNSNIIKNGLSDLVTVIE